MDLPASIVAQGSTQGLPAPASVGLSVIIPIYNEATNIERTVRTVVRYLNDHLASWEVLVVSDGSTDFPGKALESLLESHPQVRLIEYSPNKGKGAAVRRGFSEALGARMLFTDADLSTPVEEIASVLEAAEAGADVVIGSRRLPESRLEVQQGLLRRLSGRSFSSFVRLSTGLPHRDTQCGFKLLNRSAATAIVNSSRENGFAFDVEWLCLAREHQFVVREVPVAWRNDEASSVSMLRHGWKMLVSCLRLADPCRLPSVFQRQIMIACLIGLLATLGFRMMTMGALPLFDSTEGRYGAIALEMAESGDWVTPRVIRRGELVPYWGKPPLFFWLSALSIRCFGPSEWAVRLPSLLASIGVAWLVFRLAFRLGGKELAYLSLLILSTSSLFVAASGLVALDALTSLTVTGMIASFVFASDGSKKWAYLFFVFLASGLLAKGPIVVILGVAPIALYCVWARRMKSLLALPWISGAGIVLVTASPWYLLAEHRTPGFLEYFFLHEHILRYVSRELGDLYGKARVSPYGWAWVLLLIGTIPWGPLALLRARSFLRACRHSLGERASPWWLILLWGFFPALFFMFARSVLGTYLLPGLGGVSILIGRHLQLQLESERGWQIPLLLVPAATFLLCFVALVLGVSFGEPVRLLPLILGVIASFLLALTGFSVKVRGTLLVLTSVGPWVLFTTVWFGFPGLEAQGSTRALIRITESETPTAARLIIVGRGEPSVYFYRAGEILRLDDPWDPRLISCIQDQTSDAYLIRSKYLWKLPESARDLELVIELGRFMVFKDHSSPR